MAQRSPDYINQHMSTLVRTINKAGDLITMRNHYAAMWVLWKLIPMLDEKERNEFLQYRKFIPEWEEQIKATKGFNWSQTLFRKNRKVVRYEKNVEELYWNIYQKMVDSGYFDFKKIFFGVTPTVTMKTETDKPKEKPFPERLSEDLI